MSDLTFGVDFGTTNSLAAFVIGDEVQTLTDEDDKPHPSVVWYRGAEIIVGREAKGHLQSLETDAAHGFVRSPKMSLRREGAVHILGKAVDPIDIVAEVLSYIRRNAADRDTDGYEISRAVMTIPVDFAGPQRRALRAAARKAGIGVLQFVQEPAAALYAYVRSKPNFSQELSRLENKVVLVFDWGGGTLDLTVCRVLGGTIMQIANLGNNEIGGDRFDERLRNQIRNKHTEPYGIKDVNALEQPGSSAKLLTQCEQAKIALSSEDLFTVIAKDYLRSSGPERNLSVDITRNELELLSEDLVQRGLSKIDQLLEEALLDRSDIELCIATGGMVNMPAIWNGLVERFGTRVPDLSNRDRIIAEGAAWIAHDGLRLTLAKPLEVLVSDGIGRGSCLPLVDTTQILPVENEIIPVCSKRFFCIDPRDGSAVFEFAKPRKVGLLQENDERVKLASLNLPVDPKARPFLERLECEIQIDHDYVAHIRLISKGRREMVETEIHNLDFCLNLSNVNGRDSEARYDNKFVQSGSKKKNSKSETQHTMTDSFKFKVTLRSNISMDEDWRLIPGDLVSIWRPNFLEKRSRESTNIQREEQMYYETCVYCGRTQYQIDNHGPIKECHGRRCG